MWPTLYWIVHNSIIHDFLGKTDFFKLNPSFNTTRSFI